MENRTRGEPNTKERETPKFRRKIEKEEEDWTGDRGDRRKIAQE